MSTIYVNVVFSAKASKFALHDLGTGMIRPKNLICDARSILQKLLRSVHVFHFLIDLAHVEICHGQLLAVVLLNLQLHLSNWSG